MEKRVFVKDLKPKDEINEIFLVKYIAVMEARDGRNYLNMVLADKTADLESRKWTDAQEIADNVGRGDFVKVEGKVNIYQGRPQLIIQNIEIIDAEELDRSDFIPAAAASSDSMFEELIDIVETLDDVYLRDLLKVVLFDKEIQRRLKLWPAGKTIHHAYQGGLLEHILSCTKLAATLSEHYQVNKNYVVAGAVLHDICKIYELSDGLNVDYTEEGKLVGHLVKAVELVDRFCFKIKNFPYLTKMHLKHILVSHHGNYEYGSPKLPQTMEAQLLHLIDLMDSKMASFCEIRRTDTTAGHWSGYVKHLERIVFKGDLPHHKEYLPDTTKSVNQDMPDEENSTINSSEGLVTKKKEKSKNKYMDESKLKNTAMANLLKDFKLE